MKPDHNAIVRERRKLKKLKKFYDSEILTLQQICQQYMSWRGAILKKDAFRSVKNMDKLFYSLYHVRPWRYKKDKKRRDEYEQRTA